MEVSHQLEKLWHLQLILFAEKKLPVLPQRFNSSIKPRESISHHFTLRTFLAYDLNLGKQ